MAKNKSRSVGARIKGGLRRIGSKFRKPDFTKVLISTGLNATGGVGHALASEALAQQDVHPALESGAGTIGGLLIRTLFPGNEMADQVAGGMVGASGADLYRQRDVLMGNRGETAPATATPAGGAAPEPAARMNGSYARRAALGYPTMAPILT